MDAKITLSFNETVIKKAKRYAEDNNISLSRLTEFLLTKVTTNSNQSLEDLPISNWVSIVAEGDIEYKINRKKVVPKLSAQYFKSKK